MEFEYNEDELYHYGRKGMKWGQHIFGKVKAAKTAKKRRKNLEKAREAKAKAKQEAAEKEAKKSEIIKSRSARELYKNADLFTTQELQTAFQRLELEKKIKDIAPKEVSKGQKFVNDVTRVGGNISKLAKTGIDLYNTSAKLYNTFSDKGKDNPWQQIRDREAKQQKKARAEATESRTSNKAAKQAKKEAKQEAKQQAKQSKEAMKEAKKVYEQANKPEEYEVFTGDVYGKGTSTSTLKDKGKSFVNDWNNSKGTIIDIDFDDPSPAMARAAEAGASYVAGLLEKLDD